MVELVTGYLDFEQLDAEILRIADDFMAFGIPTVYFTFGFGCRIDKLLQSEELPVPAGAIARLIAECEADETFELGEANLYIEGGGIRFLLCHERDVHCSGEETANLMAVPRRWTRQYEHSSERRCGGEWHRLTGRPKDTRNT